MQQNTLDQICLSVAEGEGRHAYIFLPQVIRKDIHVHVKASKKVEFQGSSLDLYTDCVQKWISSHLEG